MRGCAPSRLRDALGHDLRGVQTCRINVVQADRGARKFGVAQDVAQQVLGEHGAPRADEGDLGHGYPFSVRVQCKDVQHAIR